MENYDLQTIQNTIGQSAQTIAQVVQANAQTSMAVAHLSEQMGLITNKVNAQGDEIISIKDRLDTLEYKTEISGAQNDNIRRAATIRLIEILGKETYEQSRYNKTFYSELYKDAKKYAGLHTPISNTQRGDYQRVIDYIEAWTPNQGVPALKKKADDRALIRKRNREAGYIN